MASRLFQTVVASSVLLLSGAAANGCAATVTGVESGADHDGTARDPVDAVDSVHVINGGDVIDVIDVIDVVDGGRAPDVTAFESSVADALADSRSREAGWPTTKGVYCTTPDLGPTYCCRSGADAQACFIPTEPDGSGPPCALDPDTRTCTPCELVPDAAACATPDAAVDGR